MAATTIENLSINIRRTGDTASTSMRGLSQSLNSVRSSSASASKGLGSLVSSLQRIAFYRIIRGIIKSIGQAFQEGAQNAYYFSRAIGGELASALDMLSTKSFTMTNQLGAAWATLLQTIQPILLRIIELIRKVAEAITMLFSLLGGKRTYLRAIDYTKQWAQTTSAGAAAAEEWKNQLMGFDEINRLDEPSKSGGAGGGGGTPDYGQMFEEVELPEWMQNLLEKLEDLKSRLKLTIDDVFFTWDNLNPEQIAEKAIVGLTGLLGGATGFMIGGVPGAIIGTLLGVALGLEIDALTFDHDGVISSQELGQMLKYALRGITGGIIGFTVLGGVRGALIGASIGIGLEALIQNLDFFAGENNKGSLILEDLTKAMTMFGAAKIGFKVGGPGGAILGATIGLGIENAIENFMFKDTSGWGAGDWLQAIINTLAPTIGAAIGLSVGGPAGAALGALIGIGISLGIQHIDFSGLDNLWDRIKKKFDEGEKDLKRDWDSIQKTSEDTWNSIYKFVWTDGLKLFFDDVFTMWDDAKKNAEDLWKKIGESFDKIREKFDLFKQKVEEVLGDTFIGKMLGMKSTTKETTGSVSNDIESMTIRSSSSLTEFNGRLDEVDTNILDLHADGSLLYDLGNAFDNLAARAHADLQNIIDGLGLVIGHCIDALRGLNDVANANAARIEADGSIYLQGFASGGLVTEGQLFVARESGPEMVGTIGGQTAVANNDQIVEGISAGVFNAVVSAMSASGGGNDQPVVIYMDGKEIARTTTKYQNQYARAGTM